MRYALLVVGGLLSMGCNEVERRVDFRVSGSGGVSATAEFMVVSWPPDSQVCTPSEQIGP